MESNVEVLHFSADDKVGGGGDPITAPQAWWSAAGESHQAIMLVPALGNAPSLSLLFCLDTCTIDLHLEQIISHMENTAALVELKHQAFCLRRQ